MGTEAAGGGRRCLLGSRDPSACCPAEPRTPCSAHGCLCFLLQVAVGFTMETLLGARRMQQLVQAAA